MDAGSSSVTPDMIRGQNDAGERRSVALGSGLITKTGRWRQGRRSQGVVGERVGERGSPLHGQGLKQLGVYVG